MGVRARRHADELLAQTEPRVVLATGRYIGEGFDDPRLDTLVLAMPIAWKGTMTQYAGRLHRHHDAKHEIRILDYVDHEIPVLRRMYATPNASGPTPSLATGQLTASDNLARADVSPFGGAVDKIRSICRENAGSRGRLRMRIGRYLRDLRRCLGQRLSQTPAARPSARR